MMNLVIAEKPSVAQSIAKVLGCTGRQDGYLEGGGYLVSWCVGHLIEPAEPESYDGKYEVWKKEDLPIIPEIFKYQVASATKKQFRILKELMHSDDVSCVTNACDAGREGELIFRLVYEEAGCKKPMKRLWISSMEDETIRSGFAKLKDGKEYDRLYEAALCRERADWIVGINATRLFSSLYGQTLNVGRVMTPTLVLTVVREAEIRAFKPEDFFTVILKTNIGDLSSRKFKTQEEAGELLEKCRSEGKVTITKAEQKEKQEKAPALFDLTSLQREANKRLGYTAQQTLDYTQSLYEKKLVSYPRTDSRYLTDDMEEGLTDLIAEAEMICGSKATGNQDHHAVVNSKKVTDHHAIIPTASVDKANQSELPNGEREILKLIVLRLVEAVSCPCKYTEVSLEGKCAGEDFKAKGKAVIDAGWKNIVKIPEHDPDEGSCSEKPNNLKIGDVSGLHEGDELTIDQAETKSGKTTPPKSYTEDTLLSAMERAGSDETPDEAERKGLGTPATRAGIIEKLVRIGFIERKGDKKTRYLVPTQKGESLITIVPESIQSPSMTAEWESKLLGIERGDYGPEQFMDEISDYIRQLICDNGTIPETEILMRSGYDPIGQCPHCGAEVTEKSKGFFCSNKECRFALWKDNRFFNSISKKITRQIAEQLINKGKANLKKCRSVKSRKAFDTTVILTTDENGQPQFSLDFTKGAK